MEKFLEILAPAGGWDALEAAVRTGADAVYLGGSGLNARQGAENFDQTALEKAVSYCHARGVKVYLTLNTIVFDDELKLAEQAIRGAAAAGVDAFIIQELGVAALAKACAPEIERHASTQMSVHNLWGVLQLVEFGFDRVVLSRELSAAELRYICKHSPIIIEGFIHGALCNSVSGQCYFSAMVGGRSGNRGRCAQPCRLPFQSEGCSHALSLKDLSVIDRITELHELGVCSFKIEGRLKRPEYVAAAVTACRDALEGREPDKETLRAVFSRSGFTQGYLDGELGDEMFGTRTKEDVTSAQGKIKELANLYKMERPAIPVDLALSLQADIPVKLVAVSGIHRVEISGDIPQTALTVPTTVERAQAALEKMGGTPFYLRQLTCNIADGLMLPASALNALRRQALEELLAILEAPQPKTFTPYQWEAPEPKRVSGKPILRVRLESGRQFSAKFVQRAAQIILPVEEALALQMAHSEEALLDKVILELPRISFSLEGQQKLEEQLRQAKESGFKQVMAGDYGGVYLGKSLGFTVHADFGLNLNNNLALQQWQGQLASATMSMEYALPQKKIQPPFSIGILAYGLLPLMVFRNHPAGMAGLDGKLTDRMGNQFRVKRSGDVSTLYNCVPLYLGDRQKEIAGMDFLTLYFTSETREQCAEIFEEFKKQMEIPKPYTRGLYFRRVQ